MSRLQGKKESSVPRGMYSAPESSNASSDTNPRSYLLSDNAVGFLEADFSPDLAFESSKDTVLAVEAQFKSPHIGISNLPKNLEKSDDSHSVDINNKKKSQMSPDNYGQFTYQRQQSDIGDIRHQLLVQRTFNNHDDHPEPRTSSPLRKIRICTVGSGVQTVTVSPSSGTLPYSYKNSEGQEKNIHQPHPNLQSPFLQSPNDNAVSAQEIFKTPNRNQFHGHPAGIEVTASHQTTRTMQSPGSTPSLGITPGRRFVNPFEIGHDRMHMPIYSPSMFTVAGSVSKATKKEESFWSVEHAALMMPVDIKEAEIHFQHRYQQRIDREQDARVQSAINKFFSNEHIVPSPWSEKIKHILPSTPRSLRSVSSQTVMSVPPLVDLYAKIEDKYLIPDTKTEPSPASDFFGNSFIRRKLLNQLNDDSELFGCSPMLASVTDEDSASPLKQTTPEWEKDTPNKVGSGHFSSSPIRQVPGEKGHHHAMCENDMLASPELSPIAGRATKSLRSSGIYYSHQEDSPRAVMHLDFSSILDDPDDVGSDTKTEELVHKEGSTQQFMDSVSKTEVFSASDDRRFLTSDISHESDGHSNNSRQGTGQCKESVVTSAMFTESTSDTVATLPQLQSSHDTGYQTASLQTTNHESASNSNLSQEGAPLTSSSQDLHSFPIGFSSNFFTNLKQPKEHVFKLASPDDMMKYNKSNTSLDANGSFLGYAFESSKKKSSSADDVACLKKKDETYRVRKVLTVSDMRHLKEKSSVSRDLIQSFNEELEKSSSNTATRGSWLELSSDDFVPVTSSSQSIQDQKTSVPSSSTLPTAIRKRPDDNDNAQDVFNYFDVSMQSASSFFSSPMEKKKLIASNDINLPGKVNPSDESMSSGEKYAKFSFENDTILKEARLVLGRSEEFRYTVLQSDALESGSLYQAISKGVENEDPQTLLKEVAPLTHTPSFRIDPVNCSTPTSQILGSVQEKVHFQIEGPKLGSEIAAEILKRAGDDLARLTDLLGYEKK